MRFTIQHELDAPLDAIELAMMSPDLGPMLGHNFDSLESVQAIEHTLAATTFTRVWRFQARAPLKLLRNYRVSREMMTWDEHSTYQREARRADWCVFPGGDTDPQAPWRRHFSAEGSYRLDALDGGRTQRTVEGDLSVHLKLIGRMVERIALERLREAYAAEANALRMLCALT